MIQDPLEEQKKVWAETLDRLMKREPPMLKSRARRFRPFEATEYGALNKRGNVLSGKFGTFGGVPYPALRMIGERSLLAQAVHSARRHNILSVSNVVADEQRGEGWRIIPKRYYDKNYETQPEELERAHEAERWLMTPHPVLEPSFRGFLERLLREYMTINRGAIELLRDRRGMIRQFDLIDGSLLFPVLARVKQYIDESPGVFAKYQVPHDKENAAKDKLSSQYGIDLYNYDYLYFIDGIPYAGFTNRDVMVVQDNVPVDITKLGFPSSMLEDAITAALSFLNIQNYNDRAFTGSVVDVILTLSGNYQPDDDSWVLVEQEFRSQFSGVQNLYRIPLVPTPQGMKLEKLDLGKSNRDMMFDKLAQLTASLFCGVYRMSPTVINMKGFSSEGQSLYEANQDEIIKEAHREGFGTILTLFSDALNRILEQSPYPDMMYEWYGLDRESRKETASLNAIQIKDTKTPNELRKAAGDPEIDEEYCKEHGIPPEFAALYYLPQNPSVINNLIMALSGGQGGGNPENSQDWMDLSQFEDKNPEKENDGNLEQPPDRESFL